MHLVFYLHMLVLEILQVVFAGVRGVHRIVLIINMIFSLELLAQNTHVMVLFPVHCPHNRGQDTFFKKERIRFQCFFRNNVEVLDQVHLAIFFALGIVRPNFGFRLRFKYDVTFFYAEMFCVRAWRSTAFAASSLVTSEIKFGFKSLKVSSISEYVSKSID